MRRKRVEDNFQTPDSWPTPRPSAGEMAKCRGDGRVPGRWLLKQMSLYKQWLWVGITGCTTDNICFIIYTIYYSMHMNEKLTCETHDMKINI